ncbi:MAG: hypothetical protein HOC70_16740 [Gammaproteobacteria bacterium]|nr:hypothetical protein [Gammaproteobacteria bacterium]MBT4494895.1 hypothetical protein [Gammaproteobacteria bacterium]MBT7371877.1 hypothetical protein [Gammaproteobacteria bacterium]
MDASFDPHYQRYDPTSKRTGAENLSAELVHPSTICQTDLASISEVSALSDAATVVTVDADVSVGSGW